MEVLLYKKGNDKWILLRPKVSVSNFKIRGDFFYKEFYHF